MVIIIKKKIFAKGLSDKGLLTQIYKEHLKLNSIKTTQLKNRSKTLTDNRILHSTKNKWVTKPCKDTDES